MAKATTAKTARDKASVMIDDVLDVFHRLVLDDNTPASARVAAGKEILDRAEGRPRQTIENTIKDESSNKYNDIATKIRLEQLELLPKSGNDG